MKDGFEKSMELYQNRIFMMKIMNMMLKRPRKILMKPKIKCLKKMQNKKIRNDINDDLNDKENHLTPDEAETQEF